ncbi:arginase family protein [Ammoniphilus sp. YIM 78166]|uniref:arginase family protein n=1 Tax=Ammoniphilus sp. YIM 78166 TaxID=1644106 RepID=UPI00106FF1F0|nr:arginase family protein [Ammoniphilus sp. YIM 78166]
MRIKVIGVPTFSGALYPGTENAPQAIRVAGLIDRLLDGGCDVEDVGDLELPPYLPRHNIEPIRNWPAPRQVWEAMAKQSHTLFSAGTFSLILGGDCSIIVGSVECLGKEWGSQVYVLSIDAHIDAIAPSRVLDSVQALQGWDCGF